MADNQNKTEQSEPQRLYWFDEKGDMVATNSWLMPDGVIRVGDPPPKNPPTDFSWVIVKKSDVDTGKTDK